MAFRTTPEVVQDFLGDDWGKRYDGSEPSLKRDIRWANLLIVRLKACAAERSYSHSVAELTELELLLACHHYKSHDTPKQEGDAGQYGMYLERTNYGQDALTLDGSGCLRALMKGQVARTIWLGKGESDEASFDDWN